MVFGSTHPIKKTEEMQIFIKRFLAVQPQESLFLSRNLQKKK